MNNESDFQIGDWNPEQKFTKHERFDVKEGADNVYRILPPMHSLAKLGQYAKYWRIHWCFHGTKKKADGSFVKYPIVCSEEMDYKTKEIKHRCPICDLARENKAEYDYLDHSGKLTADQLSVVNKTKVMPFQGNGQFYVNAINIDGKIGVLGLKKTAKDALEARCKELKDAEGINPIGMNGIYLNFKRRKGSSGKTVYECIPFMIPDETNPRAKVYKEHILAGEAMFERLRTETRDLTTLFTRVSDDILAAMVGASEEDCATLVDRALGSSRTQTNVVEQNHITIPESGGAQAVANVKIDRNLNINVNIPQASKQGFSRKVEAELVDGDDFPEFTPPPVPATKPARTIAPDPFTSTTKQVAPRKEPTPAAIVNPFGGEEIPDLQDDEIFKNFMNSRFGNK